MTTDMEASAKTTAADGLTIVPASEAKGLAALTPHLFRLSFPVGWRSP